MAAWRYNIYLLVLKNVVSLHDHVIFSNVHVHILLGFMTAEHE